MSPLQPPIHVVRNVTTMLESNRRTGRGQTKEITTLNDVICLLFLYNCPSASLISRFAYVLFANVVMLAKPHSFPEVFYVRVVQTILQF